MWHPGPDRPIQNINNNVSACDVLITPACIRALYQVPLPQLYRPVSVTNSLGVFEEGDYYSQEDLNLFFANFTPWIPNGTHPTPQFIDGAEAPVPVADAGGESDLDFELIYPLIWPQKVSLYQTDDEFYATNPNSTSTGGFNTFLDAIDGVSGSFCHDLIFLLTPSSHTVPTLPSERLEMTQSSTLPTPTPTPGATRVSYSAECTNQQMSSRYHMEDKKPICLRTTNRGNATSKAALSDALVTLHVHDEWNTNNLYRFMKLGLQGISILYASGDDGVAGPAGDDSANGCLGPASTIFSPAWPNSCPYLTNVGATKVYLGHTVYEPESAVVDPAGHPYRRAFSSG